MIDHIELNDMSDDIEEVVVPTERPKIEVKPDLLHEAVTAAEDALIAANAPIFQRGDTLVLPVTTSVGAADGRNTETPALKIIESATLRDYLSRVAVFTKYDKRGK